MSSYWVFHEEQLKKAIAAWRDAKLAAGGRPQDVATAADSVHAFLNSAQANDMRMKRQ